MRYWRLLIRSAVAASALACFCPCRNAGAGMPPPTRAFLELYGGWDYLNWAEYDDAGRELLEEEGVLLRAGAAVSTPPAGTLVARARGEVFCGATPYDGALQDGTPVRSTTDYLGLGAEVELALAARKGRLALEPFGGLGLRAWVRALDSRDDRRFGYDEYWAATYLIAGLAAAVGTGADTELFARAGARVGLRNAESIDLAIQDGPAIDLEPGADTGPFAEAGLRWHRLAVSLFYEEYNFERSESEIVGPVEVWQPRSEGRIGGLRIACRL